MEQENTFSAFLRKEREHYLKKAERYALGAALYQVFKKKLDTITEEDGRWKNNPTLIVELNSSTSYTPGDSISAVSIDSSLEEDRFKGFYHSHITAYFKPPPLEKQ